MPTNSDLPLSPNDPLPPRASEGFTELHAKWVQCLDARHPNSIMQQLYEQTWRHAIFRILAHSRRTASGSKPQQHGPWASVHSLLERCYFESSLSAIRRQIDGSGLDGARGVHALKPLIRDMLDNHKQFTRLNMFAIAGLPLDPEPRRARFMQWVRETIEDNGTGICPSELDSQPIESLHMAVDQLTGKTPSTRSEHDFIPASFFEALLERIQALSGLARLTDKFIAHAATKESIAAHTTMQPRATFEDLWTAHETLCRTAQLIDCYLLRQTSHSFLPITSGDVLSYLDSPLVAQSELPALRLAWKAYEAEIESWGNTTPDWLTAPTPNPSS